MLSKTMWKALNEQIKHELESGYLYLAMAAWLNEQALPGFAHWMKMQAKEELDHAMKIYDYIEDRGNRVELQPIEASHKKWDSIVDVMEKTLKHEEMVTGLIAKLVTMAQTEKDYASVAFLQWFVNEQVEEEKSVRDIVDRLKLIKPAGSGILFLDSEMGRRGKK